MRVHENIREQVRAALTALLVQARQIWDVGVQHEKRHSLDEIIVRLMVGVGDIARVVRGGGLNHSDDVIADTERGLELKKELGNVLFSMIRWIDDLGLDPLECLDLAIAAQEKFAKSGRRR